MRHIPEEFGANFGEHCSWTIRTAIVCAPSPDESVEGDYLGLDGLMGGVRGKHSAQGMAEAFDGLSGSPSKVLLYLVTLCLPQGATILWRRGKDVDSAGESLRTVC